MGKTKKVENKEKNGTLKKALLAIIVIAVYLVFVLFVGTMPNLGEKEAFSIGLFLKYFVIYFVFLILIIFLFKKDLKENIKEFFSKKKNILLTILYLAIFFVLSYVVANFIKMGYSSLKNISPEQLTDSSNQVIFNIFHGGALGIIFIFFYTVVFNPIVDELVFRKSLGDAIKSPILFIIFSSLLSWYFQVSIFSPTIPEFVLAIGSLLNALFAAYIYSKKKNILFTIIPRMILNCFPLIMELLLITK